MPTPSTSPTAPAVCAIGLRVEDAAATLDRARAPARPAVPPGGRTGRTGNSRRCAASAAASSISSIPRASLAGCGTSNSPPTGGGGGRRRPHRGRSHLPIHALRGDADLGAVLHLAARSEENAGAGRARSRRSRQKPGGAVARRRAAHRAQRLASRRAPSPRAFSTRRSARASSTSRSRPTTLRRRSRGLRANGVALLPIPENYYDDLEAKTDLPPERIAELQRAQYPLRPRRRRANTCRPIPAPSRAVLFRDRRAPRRLSRLRRRQRADPPRRADAGSPASTPSRRASERKSDARPSLIGHRAARLGRL